MGNEHDQDKWLGSMLRRSAGAPADACLDAETLAAWADGGLDAKASAAVELHASNCSRCAAVLAAMERTAPAVSTAHAWTPARLVRWLVPMTAAATAIAIWIAVSDRPMTPVEPAPAHNMTSSSEPGTRSAEPTPVGPEPETRNREPGISNREPRTGNLERGTRNLDSRGELRADAPSVRQEELQLRDELSRERVAPQDARSAPAAAPVAAAPESTAPPAPAAVAPATPFGTDTLTGTLTEATESVARRVAVSNESVSPANPQVRWRIRDAMFVERSTNGGKTWTRTTPPPGVAPDSTLALTVVAVRAVDANRAIVRTSDSAEFYTTNAGRSWTRVQENSVAPF